MMKHSRWKGCEGVGVKKKNREMMGLGMNEMGWEMKRFERGETGENNRREGGEIIGIKT